jgi:hypothetical protein
MCGCPPKTNVERLLLQSSFAYSNLHESICSDKYTTPIFGRFNFRTIKLNTKVNISQCRAKRNSRDVFTPLHQIRSDPEAGGFAMDPKRIQVPVNQLFWVHVTMQNISRTTYFMLSPEHITTYYSFGSFNFWYAPSRFLRCLPHLTVLSHSFARVFMKCISCKF